MYEYQVIPQFYQRLEFLKNLLMTFACHFTALELLLHLQNKRTSNYVL